MIPNPKIYISTRNPIKSPSPDLKNKNRIANTSIQITNVKRYLENVKKHHKAQHPQIARVEQLQTLSPSIESSRLQEQSLRRRIYELEIENNQFRVIAKECEMLAKRNHELEEQMLLLLTEIENQEEQRSLNQFEPSELSSARVEKEGISTKERFFTTQQSSKEQLQHEIQPKAFRTESSQKERVRTEPFQDVNLASRRRQKQQFAIEGDYMVANQNSKLKDLIDHEIKAALQIFELKFIKYIQSIEQKLQELKKNNVQMLELKVSNHQAFGYSQSSSNEQKKVEYKYQTSSRKRYKQSSENSLVNIEIESCTDSNPSFGKSKTRKHEDKLFASPEPVNKSIFKEEMEKQSEDPINSKFTDIVMERVYENIEYLRENLTFILGQKSKINQPLIQQFQKKVYNDLKSLFNTFFSDRKQQLSLSPRENQLLNENIQMRLRIRDLNDDICGLKKDLKLKVDEECHSSSPRIQSSRHLDSSSRSAIPLSIGWQHFEQTEKRLIRVINIMRSFNQQYQHILQRSRALSAQPAPGTDRPL